MTTIPEEEVEAAAKAMAGTDWDALVNEDKSLSREDWIESQWICFQIDAKAALLAAAKVRGARERNDVREECARVCDTISAQWDLAQAGAEDQGATEIMLAIRKRGDVSRNCARQIRALKETGHG